MLYAENEKQRTFIDLYRFSLTTIDLDREMLNRFDEVFDEELIVSGLERRFTQQARLVEQTADRARAVAVDWLGDEWTLQFVRIGSRWWISGYTFEHDSNWFEFDAELAELLPCLRLVEGPTRTVCRDLATRIKRGDFQSPDEARQAYLKTFIDYARNNKAAFRPLEEYIRSHPDQRDKIIMLGMEAMVELSR